MTIDQISTDDLERLLLNAYVLEDRCDQFLRRDAERQRLKREKRARKDIDGHHPEGGPGLHIETERNDRLPEPVSGSTTARHVYGLKGSGIDDAHLSRHSGKSTLPHLDNEVRRLDSLAPARLSMIDEPEYRAVQARYDSAHEAALGRRAPPPRGREGLYAYAYRLAEDLLPGCPRFKDIPSLTGVGISAFKAMEPEIIADAIAEAHTPTMLKKGELREMARYDEAGRKYYEYYGDPDVWMSQFKGPTKRLFGIRTANITGYYPNS